MEQYKEGRVPDNIMVLQIALRAALDKMKNLEAFAYVCTDPDVCASNMTDV
jgi:hypothetical protein